MHVKAMCLFVLLAADGAGAVLVLRMVDDLALRLELHDRSRFVEGLSLAALFVAMLAFQRLYVRRHQFPTEVRHIVAAAAQAFLLWLALGALGAESGSEARFDLAMAGVSSMGMAAVTGIVRRIAKPLLFRWGLWRKDVVLVGGGTRGRRIARTLSRDHFAGLVVVAVIDGEGEDSPLGGRGTKGGLHELERVLQARSAPCDLLIVMSDVDRVRLEALIHQTGRRVESIWLVPDLLGLSMLGVEVENVRGTLAVRLKQNLLKPWNRAFKRSVDVGLASILMLLYVPLLVSVLIAVRLESPGPLFFRQRRMGRAGKPFSCIKIRTMYPDADERLKRFFQEHPSREDEWRRFAKVRGNDPRVTRVGRLLRRFSIDEVPQLWNILRGEMSVIGPRPYLEEEVDNMGGARAIITSVHPGLTGLWQVSGRNELSFRERVEMDEYYVRNWTLGLDLWILLQTVRVVLTGRGAY